jgi:hypothetical protein
MGVGQSSGSAQGSSHGQGAGLQVAHIPRLSCRLPCWNATVYTADLACNPGTNGLLSRFVQASTPLDENKSVRPADRNSTPISLSACYCVRRHVSLASAASLIKPESARSPG